MISSISLKFLQYVEAFCKTILLHEDIKGGEREREREREGGGGMRETGTQTERHDWISYTMGIL